MDLPRTPKEAGIPGYHKIAVFATIYSEAFCCIFFHLLHLPKIARYDISISDDFGSFNAFGKQLSTIHSFNSEEIFMFYSFVHPRNNL